MGERRAEPSLPELVARVKAATATLVHQEVGLAKLELRVQGRTLGFGVVFLVAAGLVGYLGLLMIIVAASFAMTYAAGGTPLDVGFIATGMTFFVTASMLGTGGLLLARKMRGPQRTLRTLTDDLRWARHPTVAPNPELEALRATHRFPRRS